MTAESFDLTNGAVFLRLTCALFILPHMYFKMFGNPPPASKTFIDAGYPRPLLFVRLALCVEIVIATALFFDFYTSYVALLMAAFLLIAATSVFFANQKEWIWIWGKGGKEYPVFWALACIALAMLYWQ